MVKVMRMKKRYQVKKSGNEYKIWDVKKKTFIKLSGWKVFEGADDFCHEMNRLC